VKAETQQFTLNICKNIFEEWEKRKKYFYKNLYCEYFFSPGATTPSGVVFYSPLAGFSLLACEVS